MSRALKALAIVFSCLPSIVQLVDPSQAEQVKFVLSFSRIWRPSKDFDFHLVLFENSNYSLPVSFTANLTLNDKSLAVQNFVQNNYGYQKHTFKNIQEAVSKLTGDDEDFISPVVTVTFTDSLKNYTDINSYQTKLAEQFVFIQTDKAIYKPSQNVKIRVVALDRDLMPLAASGVTVTVQNPNDDILQQWTGVTLQNGLYATNFSLSDFVAFGSWKISVKGSGIPDSEKTFTVQQYVLPKYDATFEFPPDSYWLATKDGDYKGYVKAKYTFGKPVKGKGYVVLTSTGGCQWRYDSQYIYDMPIIQPALDVVVPEGGDAAIGVGKMIARPFPAANPPKRLNVSFTLAGDGSDDDGVFVIKGLRKDILFFDRPTALDSELLPYNNSQCTLSFEANVTEELTGEVIKASGSVPLYSAAYSIKTHESVQRTLKPGLPFTMRFQVTRPDGSPVSASVQVSVKVYSELKVAPTTPAPDDGASSSMIMGRRPGLFVPPYYSGVNCWSIQQGSVDEKQLTPQTYNLNTDSNGLVSIDVTPSANISNIYFLATIPSAPSVKFCDNRSPPQSVSNQALSIRIDRPISAQSTIPKVNDKLTFKISSTFQTPNPYVYFVLSQNGQVLDYRKLTQSQFSGTGSLFSVDVTLPSNAAPRASALVWTIIGTPTNVSEILADAVDFKVDGLVKQNVTATFSPASARPSDSVQLRVKTTDPNATVALLAVDKSVKLLGGGNDITLDDVLGVVDGGENGGPIVSPMFMRCWACGWWPRWIDSSNADSVFSGVGMVIKSNAITSAQIMWLPYYRGYMPDMVADNARAGPIPVMAAGMAVPPAMPMAVPSMQGMPGAGAKAGGAGPQPQSQPEPVVRKNFPESWIWTIEQTNAAGELVKSYDAPDTITTWVLSALAVGKSGFGALSKPAEVTVFQDFFVNIDVAQPTIIRGEQVQIKGVVFNYQQSPLNVNSLLKQSPDFDVSLDDGKTYSSSNFTRSVQVPANGGSSIPIWVKPKTLGNINMELSGVAQNNAKSADALRKQVMVEAEGEVRYANRPMLIRLGNGAMKTSINVDEMLGAAANQVVDGSKFFQLQAMGDILGPALTNLGKQIRLPTGCGEQTMLTLAPNVYITKYLRSANSLTPELDARARQFVEDGYKHELTYQREDGGFSAFGTSDNSSSTWLSAFVIRCFHAAAKHMKTPIDPNVFTNTWNFLKRQSKTDGMFSEPGRVIHYSMKGGATSDINLAIYIYTTFAEAGGLDQYKWPGLTATKNIVVQSATNAANRDAYQLALAAYALSILPGDRAISARVLTQLMSLQNANSKDGVLFWQLNTTTSSNPYAEQSGPTQIETAAYALLAMVNNNQTENAISVARYLMSQRNSLGGFHSTQDTVVGLQALSEIAPSLTSTNTALNIDATFVFADGKSNISANMKINPGNARVLQSFDPDRLRQALKSVELAISGTGVGLVQLAIKYNVQNQKILDSGDFSLSVVRDIAVRRRRQAAASSGSLSDVNVQLKACTRPVTSKGSRGMVVMEVGVPTGFDHDLAGTQAANRNGTAYVAPLKMIEAGDRKLVYYFDSFESNTNGTCVAVKILRTAAAKNVQPPIARVYAYYTPDVRNATAFSFRGMSL